MENKSIFSFFISKGSIKIFDHKIFLWDTHFSAIRAFVYRLMPNTLSKKNLIINLNLKFLLYNTRVLDDSNKQNITVILYLISILYRVKELIFDLIKLLIN